MKFSRFVHLSLPLQFGIFLALLLPLLWFFIGFNLHRLYEQTNLNNRLNTENLVRAFAEEVKSSVNSIDFTLIDLREEWFRQSKDQFAEVVKRRQAYLEENVGFQVAVIDTAGMLAFSSSDPDAKPISLRDREHFQVHLNSTDDELFISKPILGRVTQRWSIQFTRPLEDARGNFAGVIVLSVAPEYFSRFYNTLDLGKDSSISLVRTSGEILARSPNPELALGKEIKDASLIRQRSAESGLYEKYSEIDGIQRLYGWRVLPKRELAVFVGHSIDEMFASYYQQRRAYIYGGLGVSLLFGVIGYLLLVGLHKLHAEQRRIKILLENSHDAFVAINSSGCITDWNSRAEKTFGWRADEVIGKELGDVIIPEEKREAHNAGFRRFTASGQSQLINTVIEVEGLHRNGRRIPLELAIAGFHDGKGYASNAFIRDISERKEAEKQALEKNLILEETQKALQQSQKMEALGRLTGGIAHDFNNVLQTLSTGIQVAQFSIQGTSAVSALDACERAVQRGVGLARQLSVFGRVQEANLRTIDLRDQFEDIMPLLRGALPSNIDLKIKLEEPLWMVKIDPLQLELALLNLAMNARDAMPNGGCFSIIGKNLALTNRLADLTPGDYVHFVIADTGEGMSADVLAKALDPFFTTKPIGKGSGMGLPQVYGFAKQMGGTLSLHSEPGQGLTIHLYLPRTEEDAVADGVHPPAMETIPRSEGSILFIEDDLLVRQTVLPALEAAGFSVVAADNGEDAMQLLDSGKKFDLIFSDIVMPGTISGIDLAEIVQRRFPECRILLATGYSERSLSSSDVRILSKPYDLATLINAINAEMAA